MIKSQFVTLGARIPAALKRQIADYCDRKGIKLQFFITEAIVEKLDDLAQDELDQKIVDERLKNARFTTRDELDKYIQKRKKSG